MATLLSAKPPSSCRSPDLGGEMRMFEAAHAKRYAERMTAYLGLGVQSHVIEVASHDGHLLQHFSSSVFPSSASNPTMPRPFAR